MKHDEKKVMEIFKKLREEFKSQIPGRIEKLHQLLNVITQDRMALNIAKELLRDAHNLHGSSRTFGFDNIAKNASALASAARQLLNDHEITSCQVRRMGFLINDLETQVSELGADL